MSTAPHYVARRYGELHATVLALFPGLLALLSLVGLLGLVSLVSLVSRQRIKVFHRAQGMVSSCPPKTV